MEILKSITIILFAGLFFGYIIKKIKLPSITGNILCGIIIGPYVLKLISIKDVNNLEIISQIALSFISFSIGTEFNFKSVKKMGIKPFIIALTSALLTFLLVTSTLLIFNCNPILALLLGGIASSTAPAIIMLMIKEYKAKGNLTKTLLSVVAIDDIISIIIFGFVLAISKNISTKNLEFISFLEPFYEIVLSLIIGILLGFLLGQLLKRVKSDSSILSIIIAYILLIIVIMDYFNISQLLTCMISGCTFVNLYKPRITNKMINLSDYITPPILVIFFVLSGALLDVSSLKAIGFLGIIYLISRSVGKMFGAFVGAKIVKADKNVTKYLGPTLLSQTGLAIGLVMVAKTKLPEIGNKLATIVLASSLVFDLLSPIIIKMMLKKAKEIK